MDFLGIIGCNEGQIVYTWHLFLYSIFAMRDRGGARRRNYVVRDNGRRQYRNWF